MPDDRDPSEMPAPSPGMGRGMDKPGTLRPAHLPVVPGWASELAFPLTICAAALAIYAGVLHGPFLFDDLPSIRDNLLVRDLGNYLGSWDGYDQRLNRWLAYLSFALNYRWGGLDTTGFHAVNVAIHAANGLLVYALVRCLVRTPALRSSGLRTWEAPLAFGAALLFTCHPLQTQAVAYIVQRLTSLATTFYLGAVVIYLRWRLAREAGRARGWRGAAGPLAAAVAALLAMKTKEIAFTAPLAAVLCEVLLFDGPWKARLVGLASLLATLPVIPAAILSTGRTAGAILDDVTRVTRVQTDLSRLDYLATQATVVASYLRLLVLPVGQNLDPDPPLRHSFQDPAVLAGLLLHAALVAGAVWLWRASSARRPRSVDPAVRLVALGVAWFYLALAVESSLIPIVDAMFEHRVYLPSVGAALAAATGGALLARRLAPSGRGPAALMAGALVLSTVLGTAAAVRCQVWRSAVALWADAVSKSPAKSRPHNNLATALAEIDRIEEALPHALLAVALDPSNAEAHYNSGRLLLLRGDAGGAVSALREALALRPAYPEALANLGAALIRLGRVAEARATLEGAGDLVRRDPRGLYNLAVACALLGDAVAAERELARLRPLDPVLASQLEATLGSLRAAGQAPR